MRKPNSPFLAHIYELMIMLRYSMATIEANLHTEVTFDAAELDPRLAEHLVGNLNALLPVGVGLVEWAVVTDNLLDASLDDAATAVRTGEPGDVHGGTQRGLTLAGGVVDRIPLGVFNPLVLGGTLPPLQLLLNPLREVVGANTDFDVSGDFLLDVHVVRRSPLTDNHL